MPDHHAERCVAGRARAGRGLWSQPLTQLWNSPYCKVLAADRAGQRIPLRTMRQRGWHVHRSATPP
eukprot:4953109-Lingulodinium_polyedra.AAC.1